MLLFLKYNRGIIIVQELYEIRLSILRKAYIVKLLFILIVDDIRVSVGKKGNNEYRKYAKWVEKTINLERAKVNEKTRHAERAITCEKTIVCERATLNEKTKKHERITKEY